MAIKPILFNTEMVRAILEEKKKCTRRIVKPPYFVDGDENDKRSLITLRTATKNSSLYRQIGQMPYPDAPYRINDILYVRETWCKNPNYDEYYFRTRESGIAPYGLKWRPSIHMPKEAARIWLKVTDVRVERLQEITSKQICREGVEVEYPHVLNGEEKRYAFLTLWNSTIKKSDLDRYGWDANPWVWVIEFERCDKPEGV